MLLGKSKLGFVSNIFCSVLFLEKDLKLSFKSVILVYSKLGSREESEVAGFFVFSHIRMTGLYNIMLNKS